MNIYDYYTEYLKSAEIHFPKDIANIITTENPSGANHFYKSFHNGADNVFPIVKKVCAKLYGHELPPLETRRKRINLKFNI